MVQLNVINTNNPVGILHTQFSAKNVVVYPNPSTGESAVLIKGAVPDQQIYITVYDMLGKIKYEKSITASADQFSEKLNLTDMADGIYVVKVKGAADSTIKLILQK